jgi:hypothetical protein
MPKKLIPLCGLVVVLQLGLASCTWAGLGGAAGSNLVVHYEFEGDYTNSGTGTVVGEPRSGATIVADPGGGLKGPSNVLKLYGNDEYVKVGNDDVEGIASVITIAAWVKSDGTNWSDASIVTRGYNWRLHVSGSANGTIQCMDTQPQGSKAGGSVNINDGEWHHVAGVYDGTEYILYVDGVQDGPSVPATGPIAQTTSHKLTIGAFERQSVVSKFYDGFIDDVRVYDRALPAEEIRQLCGFVAAKAAEPSPADGQTDVVRDVVVSWKPGVYANTHDVYFGTGLDDVSQATTTLDPNNVYKGRQDPNQYPVSLTLDLGRTYYWRVDEVNGPLDSTIYKGDVWQFAAEPFAYPISGSAIAARADSSDPAKGPENTTNGSGLDGDLHSKETTDMWLSADGRPQPARIEYKLDKVYKLHEMWVWNYNGEGLNTVYGLKNVTVQYSTDGANWMQLDGVSEFTKALGAADYAHNIVVDFDGATAKYVRITANSNWSGGMFNQYGLSEVRFFHIPLRAREPSPDSGATDVDLDVVLGWRVGREAAEHKVYFSTSRKAVVSGAAPMSTVTEASHGPLSLDLGERYFWRVDEVNDLDTPMTLEGDVWSFMTQEFLAVDDFEHYDTNDPIWENWRDGLGFVDAQGVSHPGNGTGSEVGDGTTTSYTEETVFHEGKQSMPYSYDNNKQDKAKYSEAQMTLSSPRDWTRDGVKALTLWFRGNPAAFVEAPAGTYTMSASGTDIWDQADEFRYAWKQLSGPGTIVARIGGVQNTHEFAKAGVMIRETLEADSKFAAVYITPTKADGTATKGCRFQIRATTGVSATSDSSVATNEQMAITAPYWVKLERTGAGGLNAYYSSDPATDPWHLMVWSSRVIQMTDNVYIGLALTSHNPDVVCTAEFSDVQTTGTVTPAQWTHQAIGATMISNDPEPMYVAIANSTGTPAVVYHDDPDVALTGTWTEWNIDLKDFADEGVNLVDVNSIAIGFGDRNNPQAGGAGKMYFDDVRLYPSRCILSRRPADFAKVDYVEDCVVDCKELELMAADWLAGGSDLAADLNADSTVDFRDYAVLADQWLDEQPWP